MDSASVCYLHRYAAITCPRTDNGLQLCKLFTSIHSDAPPQQHNWLQLCGLLILIYRDIGTLEHIGIGSGNCPYQYHTLLPNFQVEGKIYILLPQTFIILLSQLVTKTGVIFALQCT